MVLVLWWALDLLVEPAVVLSAFLELCDSSSMGVTCGLVLVLGLVRGSEKELLVI